MKNFFKLTIITFCFFSCSSDDNQILQEENSLNLTKREIIRTQSLSPELNTKQVQYFENFEIFADTVFNHLNEWIQRNIVIDNGSQIIFQTLIPSGEIISQREQNFDNQGRIISRRTDIPENLIQMNYQYNSDNSITVNSLNTLNNTENFYGTYYINSDGLIYKEERPTTANPNIITESLLQFDGLKPISITYNNDVVVTFNYFPNPKPINILKSTIELNNLVLLNLSLTRLAENGNYYFMDEDVDSDTIVINHQTQFNDENYIEYFKYTFISSSINNLLTTEMFYFFE